MNLFKFVRTACLPFVLCALCLMGCSDDGTGYVRAGEDPQEEPGKPSGTIAVKQKALQVSSKIHQGLFTPARAYALVLDSDLGVVDTLEASSTDRNTIKFPEHDFPSPYVKVVVEGWFHLWYAPMSMNGKFEMITDMQEVSNPRIDLMTHIDARLVENLVKKQGYSFGEAKKKAMRIVTDAFLFSASDSLPAEAFTRSYDEIAGLYAFLMRNKTDNSFASDLESLRTDLLDGEFNSTGAKSKFADYILSNWLSADSILNALDENGSVRKWEFFERVIEGGYGLPVCKGRLGKVDTVRVDFSDYDRKRLVCDANNDEGTLVYFRRPLSDLETKLGPCVPLDSAVDVPSAARAKDSIYYKCLNTYSTFGLSKDSSHLEFKNDWVLADSEFLHNYFLGTCDSKIVGQKALSHDSVYVCMFRDWYKTYYWSYESKDTLTYYLGVCDTGSVWKLGYLPDSTQYVCTQDSWQEPNYITLFLANQRPCDREKDQLRSFSYADLFYYVCDDVQYGGWPSVYSFKDTTKSVADSLAFIASQEPCGETNLGTYVFDSGSNRYYRCEKRDGVRKYYEVAAADAKPRLCAEFAKTLDACTAQSDTTEIIDCPYNNPRGATTSDIYFHCSVNDGKYVYGQLYYGDIGYYKSLHEAQSSDFCKVVGDTLQYRVDSYGYYYYCAKEDGGYKLEIIELDSLRNMLADEHMAKMAPCDVNTARWVSETFESPLGGKYYFVCDYDTNDVFALRRVDDPYYSAYSVRKYADQTGVKLKACSDEQLAARGTPVEVEDGYITDPRDSRRYRVVTIGKQTWTVDNLNYHDLEATPNLIDYSSCSENEEQCEKTGRLYYWNAAVDLPQNFDSLSVAENQCLPVQGICPAGWHIPSLEEWSQLFQYVSYYNENNGYGAWLKAVTDWYKVMKVENDAFGFSAAPVTWTTNENAYFVASNAVSGATVRRGFGVQFNYSMKYPTLFAGTLSRAYSVRCVKD